MTTAAMTSKGQVTVPKKVRDDLGLKPGDRLSFRRNAEGRYVIEAEKISLLSLAGILKWKGKAASAEEMNEAIARQLAGDHRRIRSGR